MSLFSLQHLVLKTFGPQFGSLWSIQNKYWASGFASKNAPLDFHPGLVVSDQTISQINQIAPGTSKIHHLSSSVFNCTLSKSSSKTYFLLYLSVPAHIDDFYNFKCGWKDQTLLNDDDQTRLSNHIRFWKGGNN